jgi:hypothetical protein
MQRSICSCGCGESTGGEAYRPGHDQKHRAAVERQAGGLSSLARLVDAAGAFVEGRLSVDEYGARTRAILPPGSGRQGA